MNGSGTQLYGFLDPPIQMVSYSIDEMKNVRIKDWFNVNTGYRQIWG